MYNTVQYIGAHLCTVQYIRRLHFNTVQYIGAHTSDVQYSAVYRRLHFNTVQYIGTHTSDVQYSAVYVTDNVYYLGLTTWLQGWSTRARDHKSQITRHYVLYPSIWLALLVIRHTPVTIEVENILCISYHIVHVADTLYSVAYIDAYILHWYSEISPIWNSEICTQILHVDFWILRMKRCSSVHIWPFKVCGRVVLHTLKCSLFHTWANNLLKIQKSTCMARHAIAYFSVQLDSFTGQTHMRIWPAKLQGR